MTCQYEPFDISSFHEQVDAIKNKNQQKIKEDHLKRARAKLNQARKEYKAAKKQLSK